MDSFYNIRIRTLRTIDSSCDVSGSQGRYDNCSDSCIYLWINNYCNYVVYSFGFISRVIKVTISQT